MKRSDPEEKILVSACLAGRHCRYDGKEKGIQEIAELVAEGKMIPVCPESAGGLRIPREPSEIRGDRVFSKSGEDEGLSEASLPHGGSQIKEPVLRQRLHP